jgi:hypothetical protein
VKDRAERLQRGTQNRYPCQALETANFCPFTAGTMTWQAQDGSWTLTVCVRGTFSLIHGREAALADIQEPITIERHYENDLHQGIYAPSDLVPYKPRTDVILVGSAFAADQGPVDALIARFAVGELDKSVGVIGDRLWIEGPDGLEPSPPTPFRAMPLRNERAARTADNPWGFDLTRPPVAGALALPNLEAIDDQPEEGRVIGFGALPPSASARRTLLTAEGWAWVSEGSAGPVPPGFDFAFYNAAPRDQQMGLLRNRTAIILENMHREHSRLEVKLPSVRPKVFLVSRDAERAIEVAMRCDTLWIDTDRAVMSLSWRGLIGLGAAETQGLDTILVAAEAKGRELRFKQIQRMLREGTSVSLDEELTAETVPVRRRQGASKDNVRPPTALPNVNIEDRPSDPSVDTLRMDRPLTLSDIEMVSESSMALTLSEVELPREPAALPPMGDLELVSEPGLWEDPSHSDMADTSTAHPGPPPEAQEAAASLPQDEEAPADPDEIVSEETFQDDQDDPDSNDVTGRRQGP